jgi:RNA polymerase sigma-70 factor (ECF subfamily)
MAWLHALRAEGRLYDEAVRRLHGLLLRASYREVVRRRGTLSRTDVNDLAAQCADDATVAVLGRLSSYRGASRFTTWAYKFAVLTTAVAVRRLAWRDREVPTDPMAWPIPEDISFDLPEHEAEATALAQGMRVAIDTDLTPHQREVLLAVAVHGVPIDVLAERLATTRGALYKTLHMARARLRRGLEDQGLTVPPRGRS